jgi:hypothetical protein
VVAKTIEGEILARILLRLTSGRIERQSFIPPEDLTLMIQDVEGLARIIRASQ